jgi:hypothetical protein
MGINRIMTQSLIQMPNESGPNGESVFGVLNDDFGQIRFCGNWTDISLGNSRGAFIWSNSGSAAYTGDFVELTFYGTGLNLLTVIDALGTKDFRVSVDGGAEGSNIGINASSVLNSRQYGTNQILPVVSGLTLGLHTVKIRNNGSAGDMKVYGFETINDSALVKVNPGNAYIGGQKCALVTQSSFGYAANATGARGGRLVTYLTSAGVIAQAFQAVDAAAAYLTSANHANEEVARAFHWREFGVNRADDFSTVTTAGSGNRAFTADDGVTTLTASSIAALSSTVVDAMTFNTNSEYWTFTFVGTGLDIIRRDNSGSATTFTVYVDGTNVGTLSSTANPNQTITEKIVSGLPYGTHTVKIQVGSQNFNRAVLQFLVYQPKKPTLPAGVVEIADYNVMATFVANTTVGLETVSTGVMRKFGAREMTYVGTWSTPGIDVPNNIGGFNWITSTQNDYFEYVFFGTGFDFRFLANTSNSSQNILVQVDGITLNTTNYPGAATSVYGTGVTFTGATGILNQRATGSNQNGSGFTVSGLTLGLHKVRFTQQAAGGNFLQVNSIDVITPIHTYKNTGPYSVQNMLAVGSQSLSDTRRLTALKDSDLKKKRTAVSVGVTSNPSTSSTTYSPLPEMTVVLQATGGEVQLDFFCSFGNTASSEFIIAVDGVFVTTPHMNIGSLSTAMIGFSKTITLTPGTHLLQVFYKQSSGGTGSAVGIDREFRVREVA